MTAAAQLREPPTLAANFLLGSLPSLLRDPLGMQMGAFDQCGSAAHFVLGPPGMRVDGVAFYDPDAVQYILDSPTYLNFRKDSGFYRELSELIGNGLLTAQDETWKRQRRIIQPVFTARMVDGYVSVMAQEARRLVDGWGTAESIEIDVGAEMTAVTLRIVARLLFGSDADEMIPVVNEAFPVLGKAMLRRGALAFRVPLSWPVPGNRGILAAQSALYGLCDQIIAHRRTVADPGGDLVGRLIVARDEHGDALSDSEIRDQLLIFLLAGHETTSTALTFAIHLLGRHPQLQHRLRDEVDDFAENPAAEDVRALEYTARVLKEAIRLYPPAPISNRLAAADDVVDGFRVTAGQLVVFSPWVMHRRADLWPDPLRFDPDRFLPELDEQRHRLAWMPFGHGPRGCPGQRFAMLESAVLLATVVRSFEIRAVGGEPNVTSDLTLRLRSPVRCVLTRR